MNLMPLEGVLSDPYFWALLATCLLFVMTALYQGAWKYVSGLVLGVVNLAILGGWLYSMLMTLVAYFQAFTAPDGNRAVACAWAVIWTGVSLVIPFIHHALNTDETKLGRFLACLKPEEWR